MMRCVVILRTGRITLFLVHSSGHAKGHKNYAEIKEVVHAKLIGVVSCAHESPVHIVEREMCLWAISKYFGD
jgi:hypothetical protein